MSESKRHGTGPKAPAQERRARQAEALRANLRKRKQQAKARGAPEGPGRKAPKKPDCNQS